MKMTSAVLAALAATFAGVTVQRPGRRAFAAAPGAPGRTHRFVRGRRSISDPGSGGSGHRFGEHLARARQRVERHGLLECQHGRSTDLLDEFEPQPGKYDFTSIDRLLAEARQHNVRVVPLWFATYKNGSQHYMPEWMLQAPDRYFHVINRNGEAVDSPSPFATASLEADQRAFARFHATPQGC